MKEFITKVLCFIRGHIKYPPYMEVWESKNGLQRSYYLCRRCFATIGERPHGQQKYG